ncbi:MAG: alpha-1,4-glucan--maltose-1-phosphate maltosyltransferase [Candidatus Aminicenantes bacterium]
MNPEGKKRVVIENVNPEIDGGLYAIKRVVGEKVVVQADIFADGHDQIKAVLLYRKDNEDEWKSLPMRFVENDRWEGEFTVEDRGAYYYSVQGWVDRFRTWQKNLEKKRKAGQDESAELLVGARHLEKEAGKRKGPEAQKLKEYAAVLQKGKGREEAMSLALSEKVSGLMSMPLSGEKITRYPKDLPVTVEREKALFSTWYELFPRSCGKKTGRSGTFQDCERILAEIKDMGFDVVYLPPVHPIGKTFRKGKNNSPEARPDDPGSPWAIGSSEGGHKSIHPQLGTMADFERLLDGAGDLGIEIAMDLAFQCSRDHPYVKEHPEWFLWRPDGSIQFAENPPKKYEDIIPINFESESWRELWEELKSVVLFWAKKGIKIFRVDNPHTKPFSFWEWLIPEVKKEHPDVLFLSEAFTRPKVKYHLAKVGFSQSYTYFTWRNTKKELTQYIRELTQTEVKEYFRPNFWPNTPDILPEFLQYDGRPAFITRLVLAATLSSNYGIYGPAFELCDNQGVPEKEEYINSEKFEIKQWDWEKPGNLKEFIARINQIRRENPALQTTWNVSFCEVDNDYLICYTKTTEDLSNILLIVVNLDPFHTQSGWVRIPLERLDIKADQPYLVYDLLSRDKYFWQAERNYVELNPQILPAHVFKVHRRLRREQDFDYFM